MCGIIGYVGSREAKPLLLQGLQRLEYRGTTLRASRCARRTVSTTCARFVRCESGSRPSGPNGSVSTHGLGHTRWATHGKVFVDCNAHPLTGCDAKEMSVVLNGIVENFREPASPEKEGHEFTSETDAEVGVAPRRAALQGRPRRGCLEGVLAEGHFAFVVIHHDHDDERLPARGCSRLWSAWGCSEMFLASSIAAFLLETRRVQLIEDGDDQSDHAGGRRILRRGTAPLPASATRSRSTGTTRRRRSRATRPSCSKRSTSSRTRCARRSANGIRPGGAASAPKGSGSRTSRSEPEAGSSSPRAAPRTTRPSSAATSSRSGRGFRSSPDIASERIYRNLVLSRDTLVVDLLIR